MRVHTALARSGAIHRSAALNGSVARFAGGRRAIGEFAGPVLDPTIVKFLQVVPPLTFQVVVFAPVQAIYRFREEATTGSVSAVPYAAMCSNGAVWSLYGLLQGDPTIYLCSIPAVVMGGIYAQQFAAFNAPDAPAVLPMYCGFGSIAAACGAIAVTQPPEAAVMAIGCIGSGLCVAMFSGPLLSIRSVLRERSARSIPPVFSVASTANCALVDCADMYIPGPPYYVRTGYAYQPPARTRGAGRLGPGESLLYVHRTRTSLRRAVRTVYPGTPGYGVPTASSSSTTPSSGCPTRRALPRARRSSASTSASAQHRPRE